MSTQIKKPYQPFIDIPKATGLQEHVDSPQTHKMIREVNERNNGLQDVTSIEFPPWYRFPCQEFQKGKRGKNFNYTQNAKPPTIKKGSPTQIAKSRCNGLQDFDEVFPKNIHPSNKNKSDVTKTEETTETTNEHQEEPENPPQRNSKQDLKKQIRRQTLNGIPVAPSALPISKSQTSVSSKRSQQEKRVETSDSCVNEIPSVGSQTSVSSKCSPQKETEKVDKPDSCKNETIPDKSSKSSQEDVKSSSSYPKDREKKNIKIKKPLKDQDKENSTVKKSLNKKGFNAKTTEEKDNS